MIRWCILKNVFYTRVHLITYTKMIIVYDKSFCVNNPSRPPEWFFLFFVCRKGAILSAKEVRQVVTDYVKSQELVSSENKRSVSRFSLRIATYRYSTFVLYCRVWSRREGPRRLGAGGQNLRRRLTLFYRIDPIFKMVYIRYHKYLAYYFAKCIVLGLGLKLESLYNCCMLIF